jgi:hypothetical protein
VAELVGGTWEQGGSVMRWFWQEESQPKDEHPMQEVWDELGASEELPVSPLTGLPHDPKLIEYGFPLGRSGVVYVPPQGGSVIARPPMPLVDPKLIGKDQR